MVPFLDKLIRVKNASDYMREPKILHLVFYISKKITKKDLLFNKKSTLFSI